MYRPIARTLYRNSFCRIMSVMRVSPRVMVIKLFRLAANSYESKIIKKLCAHFITRLKVLCHFEQVCNDDQQVVYSRPTYRHM